MHLAEGAGPHVFALVGKAVLAGAVGALALRKSVVQEEVCVSRTVWASESMSVSSYERLSRS
jgi:hypothetical protein